MTRGACRPAVTLAPVREAGYGHAHFWRFMGDHDQQDSALTSLPTSRGGAGRLVRRLGVSVLSLGLDPRRWTALGRIPRFLADRARFRAAGGQIASLMPILADYKAAAGEAKGHYFHQDLLVASLIHTASPVRHIDVGSRVDGFVAHVASFRRLEIFDVRPLRVVHPHIQFVQRDLSAPGDDLREITDSLSCLHALEHFGLGRYGDPIDPDGHLKGFATLASMVKPGGIFYLSVPIGAPGVFFNAHRVFAPTDVLGWARGDFELIRFDYVDDAGDLHQDQNLHATPPLEFGLGLYSLRKISH